MSYTILFIVIYCYYRRRNGYFPGSSVPQSTPWLIYIVLCLLLLNHYQFISFHHFSCYCLSFIFLIKIRNYVYACFTCMYVCAHHVCALGSQRSEEGIRSPETRVTWNHSVGSGNQTWVLCRVTSVCNCCANSSLHVF